LRGPANGANGAIGAIGGGWDFELGARLAYDLNQPLDLILEYYGGIGPLGDLPPTNQQVHQIFPGADLKFGENLVVNFGVGVGATDGANRLVYKMRIGYLFGKKK
jgi:hypothetical protein